MRVAQFAAPTPDELRHHWLARFWPALPGWGGMAVLDRSWYGRVLVERVEGFADAAEQWQRAYEEIRDFEQMLTAEGTVLVKFWLHISDAEQLERFEARAEDPLKGWKLTDEDWRNREKRRAPTRRAVEEMLERDRPRERAVDARRGRLQALRAREGDRDRLRGVEDGCADGLTASPRSAGSPGRAAFCALPLARALPWPARVRCGPSSRRRAAAARAGWAARCARRAR